MSKLHVVTAPTGAGKTHLALQKALFEAQKGNICIVAFHTRVLVEQAETLSNGIFARFSSDLPNVKIASLTQADAVPSTKLLEYFIQGHFVLLTLHTYLQTLGDLFLQPQLQLFSYFFCKKVTVFIDESHEFFNKCDQTIQLTYGTVSSYGSDFVISSSKTLMGSKHFEKYAVSAPTLHLSKIENAEHLMRFSSPDQIQPGTKECLLFKNVDFSKLLEESSFEKQMAVMPLPRPQEETGVIPWNTELFLDSFYPELRISDNVLYENPYIICRNLCIQQGDKNFVEFQKDFFEKLFKIFHYNVVYSLLNNLNHDYLIYPFGKRLQKAFKDQNWSLFDSVLLNQKQMFLTLFKAKYVEFNFEETQTVFFENLCKTFDLLWKDYIFLLRKREGKLRFHEITNVDTAFFIKVMSSSIHEIVTIFPTFHGQKVKNVQQFIEIVKAERNKFEERNSRLFQEGEDDAFEIIVDDEIETEDGTKNKTKIKKEKPPYSQSSAPPFTTYLNLFDKWSLLLLLNNNITVFTSATPNERHSRNLQTAFPENLELVNYVKHADPLDKLYVVLSNVDYFGNTKPTWKQLWQEFGQYYYENRTRPSQTTKDENECDYALLLLPSEKSARFFFERGVPNKSPYFSKVANKYESFDSGFFAERGLNRSRFAVRVASVQSSISCGLNLPNHPFLFVSFNVFKPMYTLYKHGDSLSVVGAQTLDAYSILKQGIGRIARKSKYEKEHVHERSTRILFVSKHTTFPGIMNMLYKDFGKIYDDFEIVDISDYEIELSSIFKRSRGLSVFKDFQKIVPGFSTKYFSEDIASTESFRISLLKKLVDVLNLSKTKNVSFGFEELVAHYFQFFLLVTVSDVANTLYEKFLEGKKKHVEIVTENPTKRIRKKNIYGLPSAGSLFNRYRPKEKTLKLQRISTLVKLDVEAFLENEKTNKHPSFVFKQTEDETNDPEKKLKIGRENCFQIFEKIMKQPNISQYFQSLLEIQQKT